MKTTDSGKAQGAGSRGGDPARGQGFFSRLGTIMGGIGIVLGLRDAVDDFKTKGINWKTVTKAVLGVGLAVTGFVLSIAALVGTVATAPVWGTAAALVSVASFAYAVADYFGWIDAGLDALEKAWNRTSGFWKDAWNKTKEGFSSIERNVSHSGRAF